MEKLERVIEFLDKKIIDIQNKLLTQNKDSRLYHLDSSESECEKYIEVKSMFTEELVDIIFDLKENKGFEYRLKDIFKMLIDLKHRRGQGGIFYSEEPYIYIYENILRIYFGNEKYIKTYEVLKSQMNLG